MNNKGQTLVIFIVLLPLLLAIGALMIDDSMIVYKNIQLKNTTKDIIKMNFNKRELTDEDIMMIYEKNDIPIDNVIINRKDNELNIKVSYYYTSFFGKLLDVNSYEVRTNITGYKKDNEVLFKKG